MEEKKLDLEKKLKVLEGSQIVTRLKTSTTFVRKTLMLFMMKQQIEIKSEVDAIGVNLTRNLINSL